VRSILTEFEVVTTFPLTESVTVQVADPVDSILTLLTEALKTVVAAVGETAEIVFPELVVTFQ
jgi:hypothetical protein